MADRHDPMIGAVGTSDERSEDTNFSGIDRDVGIRCATDSGVILLNSEGFMADVVNSVNDLILSGFDSLEEFAAKALDLQSEEARCALRNGVDKIYNQVQNNVDEHLSRWESVCRAHYFSMISDTRIHRGSSDMAVVPRDSNGAAGNEELLEQEDLVHKELCSLRSQLVKVERDTSRMRRELASLERNETFRGKVVGDLSNLDCVDGAVLQEVMKAAGALKIRMAKVSSLQTQRCRHVRSIDSGRGDADPVLHQLFARQGSSGNVLQKEAESASVHLQRSRSSHNGSSK